MQVRRRGGRIAGVADIADELAGIKWSHAYDLGMTDRISQRPGLGFLPAPAWRRLCKNSGHPPAKRTAMTETVCTIGHSNRPIEEFIGLLKQNDIGCVLDIRTVPRSRHNPQFGQDRLPGSLSAAGIGYRYLPGLGGLRHARKDSPNSGWRNTSFRGYADYMQTAEFAENVDAVAALAQDTRCALMCAEAVPWRCHRSLVGDALLVRGIAVEDIIGPGKRRPHKLTPFARVDGLRITYPPDEEQVTPAPPAA
jgi:hypothetical protein